MRNCRDDKPVTNGGDRLREGRKTSSWGGGGFFVLINLRGQKSCLSCVGRTFAKEKGVMTADGKKAEWVYIGGGGGSVEILLGRRGA